MQQATITLTDLSDAVVFVGSMLSSDTHTGLPAGRTVSARLIEKLVRPALQSAPPSMGITSGDSNRIERLALNTPFEVLLQHHPHPNLARAHLANLYRTGSPNPFHFALARAIEDRKIAHVVTTNYDCCIEAALRARVTPQLVVDERQAESVDWRPSDPRPIKPVVFKIHGCSEREQTMVFQLSQEGALPDWKRQMLARILKGRDVVVMGYSGLDFDICPILFGLEYKRLFWLFAESNDLEVAIAGASPNVQNVHGEESRFARVFGVLGGFDVFFGEVAHRFNMSTRATSIADELFEAEANDTYRYQLWRGALFHSISCRLGSEAVYRTMSDADARKPESLRLWSDTLERAGQYTDSIRLMYELKGSFAAERRHEDVLEALFVIAGRYYTAGRLARFLLARWRYVQRVARYRSEQVTFDEPLAEARATYLSALVLKVSALMPVAGKALAYRVGRLLLAEGAIQRAAMEHYLRGDWQEVRLLQAAGDDLGICVTVRDPYGGSTDADILLSAVDAFSHANNIVGQASAYRRLPNKDPERCEELLESLALFGLTPEFWKAFKSFAPSISERKQRLYTGFALSELMRCQYPFVSKMVAAASLLLNLARTS